MYNEIHAVYLQEIREKKKAASGVHSKTGKNGYTGKILFPTDFMSRKEKYNHRKAGRIVTSNLYDTILPMDELIELETHEQRNRLAYWRTQHDNQTIRKAMGLTNSKYYDLVKELGLSAERKKQPTGNKIAAKAKRVAAVVKESKSIATKPQELARVEEIAPPSIVTPPLQELIVDGLLLQYNGKYSSAQICKQLLKFCALLDEEENDFHVELRIVEKIKNRK
jgi:hypothetical protein